MNAKQSFKEVYGLARLNRENIHFQGQEFRFPGGYIYIGDSALIIRGNDRPIFQPGNYVPSDTRGLSRKYRRYFNVERAREVGRVPLP